MQCPNCGAQLGCRCQLTTYSDGKTVCTNCKPSYENSKNTIKKDDQVLTLQQKINLKNSG